ncbi:hypothetical protein [Propionimicrobium lymphophilum]|uniref:Uncharacterized protein n=1 Tax=Propionimicrobium lymphophilum ACS-093-V-SCH5 TaxID=883161 RepID=S2W6C2_9ACTN|nr:hypothetical protein [Propionimicrobium lymphophilum]EPD33790.1 hypothetical protein HMPREF9306_00204 [Propionimicrobium lymphophilum ACS-093-V-SCH5]
MKIDELVLYKATQEVATLEEKELELVRQILAEAAVSWRGIDVLRMAQVFDRAKGVRIYFEVNES